MLSRRAGSGWFRSARREVRRLLVVATGNITNNALLALFAEHLDAIVGAFGEVDFVELRPTALVLHGHRDGR